MVGRPLFEIPTEEALDKEKPTSCFENGKSMPLEMLKDGRSHDAVLHYKAGTEQGLVQLMA
jgi:hypothetical protein